jgi:hypothetical protein
MQKDEIMHGSVWQMGILICLKMSFKKASGWCFFPCQFLWHVTTVLRQVKTISTFLGSKLGFQKIAGILHLVKLRWLKQPS